jgi:hypothetical protein
MTMGSKSCLLALLVGAGFSFAACGSGSSGESTTADESGAGDEPTTQEGAASDVPAASEPAASEPPGDGETADEDQADAAAAGASLDQTEAHESEVATDGGDSNNADSEVEGAQDQGQSAGAGGTQAQLPEQVSTDAGVAPESDDDAPPAEDERVCPPVPIQACPDGSSPPMTCELNETGKPAWVIGDCPPASTPCTTLNEGADEVEVPEGTGKSIGDSFCFCQAQVLDCSSDSCPLTCRLRSEKGCLTPFENLEQCEDACAQESALATPACRVVNEELSRCLIANDLICASGGFDACEAEGAGREACLRTETAGP